MFREMRRRKQKLDLDKCKQILLEEKRGVLAVNGDNGYPYAVPMNFYFDVSKNAIYLHSAKDGHKVDSIIQNDKVCFTVFNSGIQKKDDWSYFVDSVITFGHACIIDDPNERLIATKKFGLKYYPSEEEVDIEIERDLNRMLLIRIDIEHLTGKHVHER